MSTRPYITLGAMSLVGLIFFATLGYRLWLAETDTISLNFQNEVARQTASFEREVLLNLEILHTLRNAVQVQTPRTQEELTRLTSNILQRLPAIQAFAWAPWVPFEDRDHLEERYRDGVDRSFWLFENTLDGTQIPVGPRDWYVPVEFIAPLEYNWAALGFDLASESRRLSALLAARYSGTMVSTASIRLVQEPDNQRGFLVFTPLYHGEPETAQERQESHYAFLNGVFRVGELFQQSIGQSAPENILFQVIDVTGTVEEILYSSHEPNDAHWQISFTYDQPLSDVAGRNWLIRAIPSTDYVNNQRGYLPLLVMLSGIVLIVLLVAYILITLKKNYELSEAKEQLEAISLTDSLTGLANRRHFDQHLQAAWAHAQRQGSGISLMMIDIDFFKPYNDEYGHLAGDRCLQQVSQALKDIPKRETDLIARYGGEEFALILPDTQNAEQIAEHCRATIEWLKTPHEYSEVSRVITISVGLCTITPNRNLSPSQLTEMADDALYKAKDAGRNRVEVYDHTST